MNNNYDPRRRRILILSLIINTCVGFCYTWSVLQSAFIETYNWDLNSVSFTFTIIMTVSSFCTFLGGIAVEKFSCRTIILVGGLLEGIGAIGLGSAHSIAALYIAGSVFGFGMALIYPCTVSNTGKFYPDKPGLVSGFMAAGMGSGAVIWAPLVSVLMKYIEVGTTLKVCGVVFLLLICIPAFFIVDAKKVIPAKDIAVAGSKDKNWRQMLKTRRFYLIAIIIVIGGSSGMMVMGHSYMIASESLGFSAAAAAMIVSIVAVFNTVGRAFWGTLSDKFGRPPIAAAIFITLITSMYLLASPVPKPLLVIAILMVGCAYGGIMGMISVLTSDAFGMRYLSINFGVMFTTVGISSLVGPTIAARVMDSTGSYSPGFILAGTLSAIGFVLALVLNYVQKKDKKIT